MQRRLFLGIIATLTATAGILQTQSIYGQSSLISDLRQGGYVIYFRHGTKAKKANPTVQLPESLKNCLIPNEPLAPTGINQMKKIGADFRQLKIPVGKIYASPVCRCAESAWYGFGQMEIKPELDGIIPEGMTDQTPLNEKLAITMRRKLSTLPAKGTNTILVAHSSNLSALTGISLEEGEAAIFKPNGVGGFSYTERLKPEAWATLASP